MLNNTNPGFLPDGTLPVPNPANQSSMPPSPVPTIGDTLNRERHLLGLFRRSYNNAVALSKFAASNPAVRTRTSTATVRSPSRRARHQPCIWRVYCEICNPFQYYGVDHDERSIAAS